MQGKCYECQESVDDNVYCPHCGTLQRCLACNQPFQFAGKFCGSCGTERGARPGDQSIQDVHTNPSVEVNHGSIVQAEGKGPVEQKQLQQPGQVAPNQTSLSPDKKEQDNPLRIILIVLGIFAVIIAAYYYFVLNQGTKTPEETTRSFVEALDNRDLEELASYILPSSKDELLEDLDFDEAPRGLEIEFVRVMDVDYYDDDNIVDVQVEVYLDADRWGESEEVYMDFELVKIKNKWLIADIY